MENGLKATLWLGWRALVRREPSIQARISNDGNRCGLGHSIQVDPGRSVGSRPGGRADGNYVSGLHRPRIIILIQV
jgi:hypothetical protein